MCAKAWLRHVHQVAAAEPARPPPPGYCLGRGCHYRIAELSVLSAMRAVHSMAQRGITTLAHRKSRVQRAAEAAVVADGVARRCRHLLLLPRDPVKTWWYSELQALHELYRHGEIQEHEAGGSYPRYLPLHARYQRLLSFEKRHYAISEQLRAQVHAAQENIGGQRCC